MVQTWDHCLSFSTLKKLLTNFDLSNFCSINEKSTEQFQIFPIIATCLSVISFSIIYNIFFLFNLREYVPFLLSLYLFLLPWTSVLKFNRILSLLFYFTKHSGVRLIFLKSPQSRYTLHKSCKVFSLLTKWNIPYF